MANPTTCLTPLKAVRQCRSDQAFDDDFRRVNRQYFKAMRIPLLRGRNFTEQEVRESAKVVIISDLLARSVFPNEEPLGKRLIMAMGNNAFEIIGIVGDIRHRGTGVRSRCRRCICPLIKLPWMNVVIRTQGRSRRALPPRCAKEVQAIDPDQPIAAVKTMDDWLEESVAAPRYRTALLALFALVALRARLHRNLRRDVLFGFATNA